MSAGNLFEALDLLPQHTALIAASAITPQEVQPTAEQDESTSCFNCSGRGQVVLDTEVVCRFCGATLEAGHDRNHHSRRHTAPIEQETIMTSENNQASSPSESDTSQPANAVAMKHHSNVLQRFGLEYVAYPRQAIPGAPCALCGDDVWDDGIVIRPLHRGSHSWSGVCDDCLARENPDLLEANYWLKAMQEVAAHGSVTSEAIEWDKRDWMARLYGRERADAMPAEDLPALAQWHNDEQALAALRAQERVAEMKRRAETTLVLTGRLSADLADVDRLAYEAASLAERPYIASVVRERYQQRRANPASGGSSYLVPEDYRRRVTRQVLQAFVADPHRPDGDALIDALVEACGISHVDAAAHIIAAAKVGGAKFKETDVQAARALTRQSRPPAADTGT
jgi:hypothetical protein